MTDGYFFDRGAPNLENVRFVHREPLTHGPLRRFAIAAAGRQPPAQKFLDYKKGARQRNLVLTSSSNIMAGDDILKIYDRKRMNACHRQRMISTQNLKPHAQSSAVFSFLSFLVCQLIVVTRGRLGIKT
jgi:hypothetical protein